MLVIGITGGIGSGKSRVCSYIEEAYDAALCIADDIGRLVCGPDGEAMPALKELFGPEFFSEDGSMDRGKVSEIAFKDPSILQKMNDIIHPAVRSFIERRIEEEKIAGRTLFVIESALLIEAGYRSICDEFWYVYANEDVRIERLELGRGMDSAKARQIMRRQQKESVFREECDRIIDNSFDFENTEIQIKDALDACLGKTVK